MTEARTYLSSLVTFKYISDNQQTPKFYETQKSSEQHQALIDEDVQAGHILYNQPYFFFKSEGTVWRVYLFKQKLRKFGYCSLTKFAENVNVTEKVRLFANMMFSLNRNTVFNLSDLIATTDIYDFIVDQTQLNNEKQYFAVELEPQSVREFQKIINILLKEDWFSFRLNGRLFPFMNQLPTIRDHDVLIKFLFSLSGSIINFRLPTELLSHDVIFKMKMNDDLNTKMIELNFPVINISDEEKSLFEKFAENHVENDDMNKTFFFTRNLAVWYMEIAKISPNVCMPITQYFSEKKNHTTNFRNFYTINVMCNTQALRSLKTNVNEAMQGTESFVPSDTSLCIQNCMLNFNIKLIMQVVNFSLVSAGNIEESSLCVLIINKLTTTVEVYNVRPTESFGDVEIVTLLKFKILNELGLEYSFYNWNFFYSSFSFNTSSSSTIKHGKHSAISLWLIHLRALNWKIVSPIEVFQQAKIEDSAEKIDYYFFSFSLKMQIKGFAVLTHENMYSNVPKFELVDFYGDDDKKISWTARVYRDWKEYASGVTRQIPVSKTFTDFNSKYYRIFSKMMNDTFTSTKDRHFNTAHFNRMVARYYESKCVLNPIVVDKAFYEEIVNKRIYRRNARFLFYMTRDDETNKRYIVFPRNLPAELKKILMSKGQIVTLFDVGKMSPSTSLMNKLITLFEFAVILCGAYFVAPLIYWMFVDFVRHVVNLFYAFSGESFTAYFEGTQELTGNTIIRDLFGILLPLSLRTLYGKRAELKEFFYDSRKRNNKQDEIRNEMKKSIRALKEKENQEELERTFREMYEKYNNTDFMDEKQAAIIKEEAKIDLKSVDESKGKKSESIFAKLFTQFYIVKAEHVQDVIELMKQNAMSARQFINFYGYGDKTLLAK